jgi:hypothetical protein
MVADNLSLNFNPGVSVERLLANADFHVGVEPVLAQEARGHRSLLQT